MNALEGLIPEPQRLEIDHVDVAATPERTWEVARRVNFARSPLIRTLFAIRTLPTRLVGRQVETLALRIDDIVAADRPGFRLLAESDREVVVGAIGKVWKLDIPYLDVRSAKAFARFAEPGYAKVAWALRVLPRGENLARIEVEVRVGATDRASWARFRRYFWLIGLASRWIRRRLLASLANELRAPSRS